MTDPNTTALYMRSINRYFSSLPALRPETVDIVLRSHLNVPESLMPLAREQVQNLKNHEAGEELKYG
ncbi:MAG: hypothetical protein ACSHXK_10770 [Oceanococcus sp.]